MTYFDPDGANVMSRANDAATKFTEFSSLGEVIQVSIGMQIDEFNSNSAYINNQPMRDARKQVNKYIEEFNIPEEEVNNFETGMIGRGYVKDYEGLAKFINEKYQPSEAMPDFTELTKQRNENLATNRKYYNKVMQNAGTGTSIGGGIVGSLVGSALDPYTAAVSLVALPAVGVSQTSRAMYTASTFMRAGAFNAALAAPLEPMIHSWKEEIGAEEYTVADSMLNIGASGLLGGTVAAAGANIGFKYRGKGFASKDRESLVEAFRKVGFEENDAQVMAQYQAEINNYPNKKATVKEAVEDIEAHQQEMENGAPKEREPDLDIENQELIDKMFEETSDDFMMTMEDGNQVNYKEYVTQQEALNTEFDGYIENYIRCTRGG